MNSDRKYQWDLSGIKHKYIETELTDISNKKLTARSVEQFPVFIIIIMVFSWLFFCALFLWFIFVVLVFRH